MFIGITVQTDKRPDSARRNIRVNHSALKLYFLTTAITILSGNAMSQERKVVGRIIDHTTQKPIKDVNIVVPGTTTATFTNQLGFFELPADASKHKTLVVSHIGFKTYELPVPRTDRFKVPMEKEHVLLKRLNLNMYPNDSRANEKQMVQNPLPAEDNVAATESSATFTGGINDFYSYMGNVLAPEIPRTGSKGFDIFFTINDAGKAIDISTSDTSTAIRNIVKQTFQKMPDWKPAMQRGNNVVQHFEISVIRLNLKTIIATELNDFYSFILNNIKYPASARRMGIEGAVYMEFELDREGNIIVMKLVKGISDDCNREVARVISMLPAELNSTLTSKTACWQFIVPIFFTLEGGGRIKGKRFDPTSDPVFLYEALMLKEVDVTAGGLVVRRREIH